jgi:hypothetical protein
VDVIDDTKYVKWKEYQIMEASNKEARVNSSKFIETVEYRIKVDTEISVQGACVKY